VDKKIPSYLLEKQNTIRIILFTAVFALLFINIFQPFNSRQWYPDITEFKYFFFSSLIILTGMLVVVISRLIMGLYSRKNEISLLQYVLWIFVEIVAMSLFYAIFSKFVPKGGEEKDFFLLFQQSAINTSLVLLIPFAMSFLYFSLKEKSKIIEAHAQKDTAEQPKKGLIAFPDEKGEIKITVALNNLIFIDSADNYATIHYINKEKKSTYLIRNSLKWIDENLSKDLPLVRCHRSYIVNLDKVKVLKKTKAGIFIELDAPNVPDMPVSKTYYEKLMNKFSQYTV